ncbi:trypsin-like serine protease with C-terminal PDZ domain [Desulfosporosinus orientis DSM 765]|uniref:Trypsin-like serine protease with C-terminal PDZ domain n=1 Tax=Desulfosporosinus orientis (strain ATCC 19365 / DSM 765 / NCIMB 8382 / VKM B-1628 / Singapore I) TaxID=768706 RepID=G7WAB5_DESOD|nr:trypsin-like peptidase domain-containing protein [Desulfosporosinus orientis]AET66464.1 trypsin-like serine protease with C-terminal PDZ domain [Desulfosporosinus orientis DSM 765]
MDEEILSEHNDNNNLSDQTVNTEQKAESTYFVQQPIAKDKPKRKLAAIAGICLISAVVGGLTTVAAVPYIYPDKTSAPLQTANTSYTQVSNLSSSSTDFPVEAIAKNVGPAVVGVANFQSSRGFSFDSNLQEVGSGSGFIIDAKKGYIATNNHVIEGAQKITVSLSDGRTVDAKLIGADPRTDLAVLQISDTSNLTAVTIGDSSKVQVGESVVAIGNPGGDEFARSVTTGVISATNRNLDLQGEASYNLIQTDAAINPGNSGGPLVNYQGQVIGINSAKYAQTGFEGMGFAIPISDAMPTLQQLIDTGVAKHPALLVTTDDQYNDYAKVNSKPQGAYISGVQLNGPAGKAGIQRGDIITKVDNVQIQNSSDLVRELYKHKVNEKVSITFIRDGQTKNVDVTLGELSST